MFVLLKKEIGEFFSSLIGYIVISVFLIITGLFLWFFPGDFNILDSGYAGLDPLFTLAPWVFLFLVPAVTMRLFAEEKRTGTIEMLFTKPLSDIEIILAKYFAGLVLVLFSLIPTLIWFFSVYMLSDVGSADSQYVRAGIDVGGTIGSYIGLFFLAAIYVAIGTLASALTKNQIIAFIVAVLLSFFFYIGFEMISSMQFWGTIGYYVENIGINAHYKSMSRGVIDSRDVIYFISVISFFILLTKITLESRKW